MSMLFPRGSSKFVIWSGNFASQLKTVGPTLGLTATEINDTQNRCQDLIDAINLADQKKKDWRAASKAVKEKRKSTLEPLRKVIARIKTSTAWNGAYAQTLGVQTTSPPPPTLDSHKPKLSVQKTAGRVALLFTRGRTDGVNIYSRKKGEAAWRVVDRFRYSPAIDATPPSTQGTPEAREYRAFALHKDQEIGQPSDIVSVTIGD